MKTTSLIWYCTKNEQKGGIDDENEADTKLDDSSEKVSIEINPLEIKLSDIIINPDADNEGEWVLNENPTFENVLSSSIDASDNDDVLLKKLNKTPALHILVTQAYQIIH